MQNVNVDIIITDETMKYISGSYFAEILFKVSGKKIPVAIVTAYEDNINKDKYTSPCIRGVFSKPINTKLLESIFKSADINF